MPPHFCIDNRPAAVHVDTHNSITKLSTLPMSSHCLTSTLNTSSRKKQSFQGYVGGIVYTKKLVLYEFITCDNDTSENTGRYLKNFIEVFGLLYSSHLDRRRNFRDYFFNQLLSRFGIFQTFTELHSPCQNQDETEIGEIKRHARKIM